MGIFRKTKGEKGKHTGPWYVQYPYERDHSTGKIKYRTERASWQKKKAQELLRQKQEDFLERDKLGIAHKRDMTFSEFMDWGLDQEVMKAKASASDDEHRARQLKAHFGEFRADQVTPLMVDNFRIRMKETVSEKTGRPYSGTTVNRTVALARKIYNLGKDAGLVQENPFSRRGKFKEHSQGKYITDEEFRTIVQELPEYVIPMIEVAYLSGMRRGEIVSLEWSRINLDKGTLDLSAEDTKTDEPRIIYLGSLPDLRLIFVEAKLKKQPGQKLVFLKPDGKPVQGYTLSRYFRKACEKAGVGPYRLHDCRHTFCTNLVKSGVGKTTIMRLTGHKTLSMFLRYSHLDQEQSESAMQSLGELLAAKRKQANEKTI